MKSHSLIRVLCGCLMVVGVAAGLLLMNGSSPLAKQAAEYGKLPLYFIENQGQADDQVAYYLQGGETSVSFTQDGVVFALSQQRKEEVAEIVPATYLRDTEPEGWAVKLEFVGANTETQPVGVGRTEAIVSYFRGPKEDWKTGLPTYAGVAYKGLWPGIDLAYSGTSGRLKYTFLVAAGADPEQIRLAYRGASALLVNGRGRLEVDTPVGGFAEDKPYVYQETEGGRVEVASAYEVDGTSFGFRLGDYDRTRPLVLDPAVLVYSGYVGGSGWDVGQKIAVDAMGNAYIVGQTFSNGLGTKPGPRKLRQDVFVAKINAAGSALIYSGYIGGSNHDHSNGIAVDGAMNAYVSGSTQSLDFAGLACKGSTNKDDRDHIDTFVTKINPDGTDLVYKHCFGGELADQASGIAVDPFGNAFVTGSTNAIDFPVTENWQGSGPNGGDDIFVVKVNLAGNVEYARYLGGSDHDRNPMGGIAVDLLGSAYVTGYTASQGFPVTPGWPYRSYEGGVTDAFVTKLDASGAIAYSGFLGSAGEDQARGIAVGPHGDAYVTGFTTGTDFPVSPQWHYPSHGNGLRDAFVTKVNWKGTRLAYSGYLGGTNSDFGNNIALGPDGNAYITGATESDDFPVVRWPGSTRAGKFDAFAAKLNFGGSKLIFSGYLGGSEIDYGNGIAVDIWGNAYLTGETQSANFPFFGMGSGFGDKVGTDPTDAFVAKISYLDEDPD